MMRIKNLAEAFVRDLLWDRPRDVYLPSRIVLQSSELRFRQQRMFGHIGKKLHCFRAEFAEHVGRE